MNFNEQLLGALFAPSVSPSSPPADVVGLPLLLLITTARCRRLCCRLLLSVNVMMLLMSHALLMQRGVVNPILVDDDAFVDEDEDGEKERALFPIVAARW